MKNFAIFLLLTNILLWAWQFSPTNELPGHQGAQTAVSSFEPGNRKLQLLSELTPAEEVKPIESSVERSPGIATQENKASEPAVPPPPAQALQIQWCGQSASVTNSADAVRFLGKWRQLNGTGELLTLQEPTTSTWWVHLPAFKDETEANKKMMELREKKIDSYYMRTGELAGGISLGVYSRKQSAAQVQADLLKKGYKTELKEVFRTESRSRLELRLQDRSRREEQDVRELLAGFQQLGVQEIPCK